MEIGKNISSEQSKDKSSKATLLIIGALLFLVIFFFILGILVTEKVLVCRDIFGRPYSTGVLSNVYEFGDAEFQAWTTIACIAKVQNISENEAFLKIGYFDKFGRMHAYNARLGGRNPLVGVCANTKGCELTPPGEVISNIKRGDLLELFIVTQDKNFQMLDSSEQTESYLIFIEKLKKALLEKSGFPKGEYFIQISQISL